MFYHVAFIKDWRKMREQKGWYRTAPEHQKHKWSDFLLVACGGVELSVAHDRTVQSSKFVFTPSFFFFFFFLLCTSVFWICFFLPPPKFFFYFFLLHSPLWFCIFHLAACSLFLLTQLTAILIIFLSLRLSSLTLSVHVWLLSLLRPSHTNTNSNKHTHTHIS